MVKLYFAIENLAVHDIGTMQYSACVLESQETFIVKKNSYHFFGELGITWNNYLAMNRDWYGEKVWDPLSPSFLLPQYYLSKWNFFLNFKGLCWKESNKYGIRNSLTANQRPWGGGLIVENIAEKSHETISLINMSRSFKYLKFNREIYCILYTFVLGWEWQDNFYHAVCIVIFEIKFPCKTETACGTV
jgi:hypothetical protein